MYAYYLSNDDYALLSGFLAGSGYTLADFGFKAITEGSQQGYWALQTDDIEDQNGIDSEEMAFIYSTGLDLQTLAMYPSTQALFFNQA